MCKCSLGFEGSARRKEVVNSERAEKPLAVSDEEREREQGPNSRADILDPYLIVKSDAIFVAVFCAIFGAIFSMNSCY